MTLNKSREQLLYLIENKRKEMELTAAQTGISSSQTLKTSRELDELLNLLLKKKVPISSSKLAYASH